MEFLTKTSAQINDLFRSMTPGARIASVLLLAVVVVSLGYLFAYHGSGTDHYLMNGQPFSPSDIPAVEAAFAKAGLNNYEFEGMKIRVPRGQQNLYMAALAENGALPPSFYQLLDEPVKSANPFESLTARQTADRVNRQKVLGAIISKMTGIKDAYVMYDTAPGSNFSRETIKTVSVGVTPLASYQIPDTQVLAIRTLVVKAIAGLKPENVAVVDLTNGRTSVGSSNGGANGMTGEDPVLSIKIKYEKEFKDKILQALITVPGVTVVPNVEIDPQQFFHQEKVENDPKTVPLHSMEKSVTDASDGPSGSGGKPGVQSPNNPLSLSSSKGTHQEKEDILNTTDSTPLTKTVTTFDKNGLTPTRVTVAVGVPNKYFEKVWQERNPGTDAAKKTPDKAALEQIRTEETAKIKQCVAALLPKFEGVSDPGQLVTVTAFQDITPPTLPPPAPTEFVLAWMSQYGSTLGMVALAVAGLLMLRSVIRAVPAGQRPVVQELHAETAAAAEPTPERARPPAAPRLRRFAGNGTSLRDELSQIVQEDPDAAANVLRTWIGTPAGKS